LLGDFESDRATGLLLNYRRSISDTAGSAQVIDFQSNQIAPPELAVDGGQFASV
jgi:hypothetical protein